jgi:hypothetical protein
VAGSVKYWTGQVNNNWGTYGNWQPAEVPTAYDSLWIESGTVNITSGLQAVAGDILLGTDEGFTEVTMVAGSELTIGGPSTAGGLEIGWAANGGGTFNQNGGTTYMDRLQLGCGGTSTSYGTYNLNDGTLQVDLELSVGVTPDAVGTFVQTGGTNTIGGYGLFIGWDDSTGVYNLSGGTLYAPNETVWGDFVQTKGTNTIQRGLYIENGTYELSDPQNTNPSLDVEGEGISLDSAAVYIGADGKFLQKGGTVTVSGAIWLTGSSGGNMPVYVMSGGSLYSDRLWVGYGATVEGCFSHSGGIVTIEKGSSHSVEVGKAYGVGTYNFGNSDSTGTLTEGGSYSAGIDLIIRDPDSYSSASGTFRGWGPVELTGTLENNGKVEAKGYGTDRTLDMSNFSEIYNGYDNGVGENNGWFAQNRGKLLLKPITVSTGTHTYNWGESAWDTTIDLVNSARLAFTNVSSGGNLNISLLATDRTDIASILPAGWNLIGLWDFDPPQNFAFQTLQLTFRYDDAQAGENESKFIVIRYNDQSQCWLANVTRGNQSGEKDITNNWLGGPVTGGLSYFAVGTGPSGDTDVDGDVDLVDLGNLAGAYGTSSGATWSVGDSDVDGDVDLVDLGMLAGNYGQSFGGDSIGGEASESEGMVPVVADEGVVSEGQLDSEGTVTVVVDEGVDVGNGLTSYTVHLVADSAYNTVTAWEGSFDGTLHQVWMRQAFGHWYTTEMISDLDGWPEELVEVDSHFMVTDVITLGGEYDPAEDNDRSEGQDPTYGTYAGVGTYLSGLFAITSAGQATDLVLAVIVIPDNEEVALTGTAANSYGDAFVTEATIPPAP